MRIATQASWAACGVAATIVIMAVATLWGGRVEERAQRQRREIDEIVLAVLQFRSASDDHVTGRLDSTEKLWAAVATRHQWLVGHGYDLGAEEAVLLDDLKRRIVSAQRILAELSTLAASDAEDESGRLLLAQMQRRLVAHQQDSLSVAYRLATIADARVEHAHRRLADITLAGLVSITLVAGALFGLFRRNVLRPVGQLADATRRIAAGHWTYVPLRHSNDEIGDLGRNFDAMVEALHATLARVEHGNEALAVANRELESFAYSVSHDLRAPLRSLDGFSLALLEDYGQRLDAEGRDMLERIRAASGRMATLIDDLLRLSRVTRAQLNHAEVDLSALAGEIARSLAVERPERKVECHVEQGLRVDGDPALLAIALRNLLENAWKFTGKRDEALVRVGARRDAAATEYYVADNGMGFDMAHAGQLFGAFQRLHLQSEFPGTGIGLAIVQRIVQRHGGSIRAEASPGRGATFYFTLGERTPGPAEATMTR